jgi:hypothetical protein
MHPGILWAAPVAVFAPATSADFDFDSLVHQAIEY